MASNRTPTGLGRGRPDYTRRTLAERKPTEARQKMWASMRVMGTFTCSSLATVTEENVRSVQTYVRKLELAHFLRCVGSEAGPGTRHIYRLIRNSGPRAPRAGDHGVADLNTGLVYDRHGNQITVPRCIYSSKRDAQRVVKASGGRRP